MNSDFFLACAMISMFLLLWAVFAALTFTQSWLFGFVLIPITFVLLSLFTDPIK